MQNLQNKNLSMTVYCGSWFGNNPKYQNAAKILGQDLAKNNITLLYGGGIFGMMGTLANEVHINGGNIHGISTKVIWDMEHSSKFVNENTGKPIIIDGFQAELAPSLAERKSKLYQLGDILCALPGSTGTLDELFEVIVFQLVGVINKPIIILNLDGYYDNTLNQINVAVKEGFASPDIFKAFNFVNQPHDIVPKALEILKNINQKI